jgi:hypothetical protein
MTQTETIDVISQRLAGLDDRRLKEVADMIEAMSVPDATRRSLSDRETKLLIAACADFANGRTVTIDESRARTDALFARYEALYDCDEADLRIHLIVHERADRTSIDLSVVSW